MADNLLLEHYGRMPRYTTAKHAGGISVRCAELQCVKEELLAGGHESLRSIIRRHWPMML